MIDGKAPPAIGYILDIAGLSIPGILPSINRLPAIYAPVFPADINRSPSPSLSIVRPFTIEESVFLLMALTGESSFSITSEACTTCILLSS